MLKLPREPYISHPVCSLGRVWGTLCPHVKYLYVKWLEQQIDLNLFHSVSFPREPACGTIIKLAETLSGHVELLFLLAGLQQHGLQLRLTTVTRGKVKMTSVLMKAAKRHLETV